MDLTRIDPTPNYLSEPFSSKERATTLSVCVIFFEKSYSRAILFFLKTSHSVVALLVKFLKLS